MSRFAEQRDKPTAAFLALAEEDESQPPAFLPGRPNALSQKPRHVAANNRWPDVHTPSICDGCPPIVLAARAYQCRLSFFGIAIFLQADRKKTSEMT
jgi:hypothetical protein